MKQTNNNFLNEALFKIDSYLVTVAGGFKIPETISEMSDDKGARKEGSEMRNMAWTGAALSAVPSIDG